MAHLLYRRHAKRGFFLWPTLWGETFVGAPGERKIYNGKNKLFCCDMFIGHGVANTLSPQFDTAEKIDTELTEFYVVSQDYSWIYIKTHENDLCGPYFLQKNNFFSFFLPQTTLLWGALSQQKAPHEAGLSVGFSCKSGEVLHPFGEAKIKDYCFPSIKPSPPESPARRDAR